MVCLEATDGVAIQVVDASNHTKMRESTRLCVRMLSLYQAIGGFVQDTVCNHLTPSCLRWLKVVLQRLFLNMPETAGPDSIWPCRDVKEALEVCADAGILPIPAEEPGAGTVWRSLFSKCASGFRLFQTTVEKFSVGLCSEVLKESWGQKT